jgi:hypothetical protein
MEFVGLLKDHEPGLIKIGQNLSDIADLEKGQIEDIENINSYLRQGTVVIPFLHSVFDAEGNFIGPLIIYTDGKWIWPSYLSYYLLRGYRSLLSDLFIADMRIQNYIPPLLEKERLEEVEMFYRSTYNPNESVR